MANTSKVLSALEAILGDRVSTKPADLDSHSQDESWHPSCAPEAVVYPNSTEEVSAITRVCAEHACPLTPYGTGTGVEGNAIPTSGGVVMDLTQMDRILAVHEADQDVVVEPGVRRTELNHELRHSGLFFPIDPGADASLGGMTATRASGTNAVRYGTMKQNVLALTVVTPSGEILRLGGRSRKSSSGYDLTQLFVGSEGTLGTICELTLKIYPIPEKIASATVSFDTINGAVNSVIQVIQQAIPLARIELLDAVQMAACNKYSKLNQPEQATLFLEFHGGEAQVQEDIQRCKTIFEDQGGHEYQWAETTEARNKLWKARHNCLYAAKSLRPNAEVLTTDVCVPISHLADCILSAQQAIESENLIAPIVGHVGDGNFHVLMVIDPKDEEECRAAERVNSMMIEQALSVGGTCTGEHGIGIGKLHYLEQEHGESLKLMQAIKKLIDPNMIMNPGKLPFPDNNS